MNPFLSLGCLVLAGLIMGILLRLISQPIFEYSGLLASSIIIAVIIGSNIQKRRYTKKQSSELYRFAEFGRLSAGIFHDLMNPLTTISLVIEKLRENDGRLHTSTAEHIEKAIKASKRIESLMRTARKQLRCDDFECFFPIKKEIEEAISLLSYKMRTSCIEIVSDVCENYEIYGNPVRFFQIMVNLTSNAIDSYQCAIPEQLASCIVTISAEIKGQKMEISVKDEGCGIPRNMQSAIFRPFFTTKLGRDGVGLGLSLTKQIIEQDFGGHIAVKSTCGEGSTFTVTLPLSKKPEKQFLHESSY